MDRVLWEGSEIFPAALELGWEVIKENHPGKDLMGELELAKLREVEMGFGGERRDEEDSKE